MTRPGKSTTDMIGQVVAVILGLLAALWYFGDSEINLASLKGKRVLITGASSGIGEQLAYQFARHGSHVTLTARRQKVLEVVSKNCSLLSPDNRTHHVIAQDMEKLNMTKNVVDQAAAMMGGLDLLILNHILPHPIEPFKAEEYDLELLQRLVDINYRSYVHLTKHALPKLSDSGGRIVVINSSMGTESAVKGIAASGQQRVQRWFKPASPAGTAEAIVQAVVNGKDELYFPWLEVRPLILLHSVWPEVVDMFIRFLAVRES
ncbi:hydroxysteroid 11-beta-dehydrogenase 1-like protein [Plakobranchus ocellatus]|uniref:Hydroxysteroid 11-beta-dehydrogenase 1-like protein n=1 Tax=Plakobranchus ocellatus TaxID=259542 RepID=A0AAV4AB19_9GAST|nr:hydroxysteroid 11-beta-dehydrogenase 1-like protein [Plakobranchus ocellatus]